MNGYQLTFFTRESEHIHHRPVAQWLLETANQNGLRGATITRATEGFGADHKIHAAHFFDLADDPMLVTMVLSEQEKESLLAVLNRENVRVFYTVTAVEFGTLGQAGATD